jgi:hypothetical protein
MSGCSEVIKELSDSGYSSNFKSVGYAGEFGILYKEKIS